MTVKLSGYIWKKIGGKIVPIRRGLTMASDAISDLAKAINHGNNKVITKLGSGVDFTAYKLAKNDDHVIKVLKNWGSKTTAGTASRSFSRRWPELKDKIAVNKTLSDNLPNYGIPTLETEIIRINRKKRGILQRFIPESSAKYPDYISREGKKLNTDHGLEIDAHFGNVRNGMLIDSGGNLRKSRINQVKHSDTAKEILGIENNYGTEVKSLVNKSTVMSKEAVLNGQSSAALRKLNGLRKKGFRFVPKKSVADEVRLVNPIPTRNQKLSKNTVRFIRVRGRIIPIRIKK